MEVSSGWRMPPADRDALPPAEQVLYDRIQATGHGQAAATAPGRGYRPEVAGSADEYYSALLYSPELAARLQALGDFGRQAVPDYLRQLAYMVAFTELDCLNRLRAQLPLSVYVGVRSDAVQALRDRDDDALTDDERLLVGYCRQVVRGTVDDATFTAMEQQLGRRSLVEYTALVAHLVSFVRFVSAMGMGRDVTESDIDELLAELSACRDRAAVRARFGDWLWRGGTGDPDGS